MIAVAETLIDYSSRLKKPVINRGGEKAGLRKFEEHREVNHRFDRPPFFKRDNPKPSKPCFICDGPHWTRECPKRKAMDALKTEMETSMTKMLLIWVLSDILEL